MFLGRSDQPTRPRTVEPGEPADLCVLSVPPETALAELDAGMVAATIVGGRNRLHGKLNQEISPMR